MLRTLLNSSRRTKQLISVCYDVCALGISFYLAVALRLGRTIIPIGQAELITLGITILVSISVFIRLGLYRAILRYMAHQALISVVLGVLVSAAVLAASSFFLHAWVPRSAPVIYAFTALFFVGAPRLFMRSLAALVSTNGSGGREKVIIYGAGHSGFQLASALLGSKYKVVGFIDDDHHLHGRLLRGLPVRSPDELPKLLRDRSIQHILLALGEASRAQRTAIIDRLEPLGISIKTMPHMSDILSGKAKIEDVKDIEIEDLLGREPVTPNPALLGACTRDLNVLVTGAGGSIGSELCRQILKQHPKRLVLFELCEYNLYRLEKELSAVINKESLPVELVAIIGSVQNYTHLKEVFTAFEIETVYHAAAYKHVPLIEHNLIEGVKNNVFGTWHCAEAAIAANVQSFVLVSTDKAVRPTNIMGTSKRLAELTLQALAQRQNNTRFTMVRFGNVLGSSGSVVPLFREQIKAGGPVTVTHPDITRYFMTIPEAAELVLQAGSMGRGGDVFVLDMGEPVKIVDLAKRMIQLSGLSVRDEQNPKGDIAIHFTGLRPGEKLYEELLIGDNVTGTDHPLIMRAEEQFLSWPAMSQLLTELQQACDSFSCERVRELLVNAPAQYFPNDKLLDSAWIAKNAQKQQRSSVVKLEAAARKSATPTS